MKGFSSLFEDVVWEKKKKKMTCCFGHRSKPVVTREINALSRFCVLTKTGCVNILFDI